MFCPRMGSVSSLVSGLVSSPPSPPSPEGAPEFPRAEPAELLSRCEAELAQAGLPRPLRRSWSLLSPQHTSPGEDIELW